MRRMWNHRLVSLGLSPARRLLADDLGRWFTSAETHLPKNPCKRVAPHFIHPWALGHDIYHTCVCLFCSLINTFFSMILFVNLFHSKGQYL